MLQNKEPLLIKKIEEKESLWRKLFKMEMKKRIDELKGFKIKWIKIQSLSSQLENNEKNLRRSDDDCKMFWEGDVSEPNWPKLNPHPY